MTHRDKNKAKKDEEITDTDKKKIIIDKRKEMRTKEISKMISEGGLGSDNYYEIIKKSLNDQED